MSTTSLPRREHSPANSPHKRAASFSAAALCTVSLSAMALSSNPAVAQSAPASSANIGGMAGMENHMHLSALRAIQPGDQARADAIVAAARQAMEPYKDYRNALADGYRIFLPNIPQPQYHFTNYANARLAAREFDPLKPTSLLYKKNPDGGYTLVGAMYTDRLIAAEDELNQRIPLSIARWHQHVNFCKAPQGEWSQYFGPNAKFGLMGSIHTQEACEAAGGVFIPHVFGWMVHVYPYETDPARIWSIDDDNSGHDNMDHSAMPGMDMNSMPGMNPK